MRAPHFNIHYEPHNVCLDCQLHVFSDGSNILPKQNWRGWGLIGKGREIPSELSDNSIDRLKHHLLLIFHYSTQSFTHGVYFGHFWDSF